MKKLDPGIARNYSPVVLYLDDLSEIIKIIKDRNNDIELSDGEYLYDSINELKEDDQKVFLHNLSINSKDPYINIAFRPHDCRLYFGSSELIPTGLFHKVDVVIRRCRRRFGWLYSWWAPYALLPIIFVIEPLFTLSPKIGVPALLFLLALMLWVFRLSLRRHSLIVLEPRASKGIKAFLRRNRDQLIIAFISAMFGFGAGLLSAFLTNTL